MNDQTVDQQFWRPFRQEAAQITQMAGQVIDFAEQTRNQDEREFYLRLAVKWLQTAGELAPA